MERRLLTLLMLSAFAMNVSAVSLREVPSALSPSNIVRLCSQTAGNAKKAVLDGAERVQDYFSNAKLKKELKEIANLNDQLRETLISKQEKVNTLQKEAETLKIARQSAIDEGQAKENNLVALLKKVQDKNNSLEQNTFKNRTRAAFGSAWSGAKHYGTKAKDGVKYCVTKAKNAVLWAPKQAVNTTLGGKMNSLSTDWTNLTTGLTPLTTGLDKTQKMNSVKQLSSNVWGSIKQLSSNAWTNKKASAKIAAATVATGVGAYYAGKLVKSASKSLYGKYQARKAAAKKEAADKNAEEARLAAEKEAADKNAEEAARLAAAEETARKSVTVVAQNPMTEVLAKLNAEQALNDADKVVVENAYRTFCKENGCLRNSSRMMSKFILQRLKITNIFIQARIENIVEKIDLTVAPTPVVADATTITTTPIPVTPVATPAVTDEIVTPTVDEKVETPEKGWVKVKNGVAFLYNKRPFQKKSDAPSAVNSASESTVKAESESETSPTSSVGDAPGSIAFTFNGR